MLEPLAGAGTQLHSRYVAAPAALTLVAALSGGPTTIGRKAVLAVLCMLVLAIVVATGRLGWSRRPVSCRVSMVALAGLAAWSLASFAWSGAGGRAVASFDEVVPYVASFALGAAVVRSRADLSRVAAWLVAVFAAIATLGLCSHLFASVVALSPAVVTSRLSYPIEYWNAMALVAAFGLCGCFAVVANDRASDRARDLAAAALPVCSGALYFTFSRAGIGVAVLGIVALVILARSWDVRSAVAATIPAVAFVVAALPANALASNDPTTGAAGREGALLFLVLVALCYASVRLRRMRHTWSLVPHRGVIAAGVIGAAAVVVVGASGSVAPERPDWTDNRDRLLFVGGEGRTTLWRLGWRSFADRPLGGDGGGTFELRWLKARPVVEEIPFQHNVFLGALGELGVVGCGLLLAALGAPLLGLRTQMRGGHRAAIAGGVLAVMWLIAATVDFQWHVAASTLPVWAFLGGVSGLPVRAGAAARRPLRIVAAALVCVAALVPTSMALSQIHLKRARAAALRGDAAVTLREARAAQRIAPYRAGPWQAAAVARYNSGDLTGALRDSDEAARKDPDFWGPHYIRALALSSSARSPRLELRKAFRVDPLEESVRFAVIDMFAGRRLQPMGDLIPVERLR